MPSTLRAVALPRNSRHNLEMSELRRASYRRGLVLSLCLGALLAIGGIGSAIGSWSAPESNSGDVYAAAFADNELLERAQQGVTADSDAHRALVQSLEPTPQELATARTVTWNILASNGSTVDVEVSFYLEDRSFSAGWSAPMVGRACRTYGIENGSVTVTSMICPAASARSVSG